MSEIKKAPRYSEKKENLRSLQLRAAGAKKIEYDLYIKAVFSAPKNSIWDKQMLWKVEKTEENLKIPEPISNILENKNCIEVKKETKSVFKGVPSILSLLNEEKIEEIHIVGADTNDCVLATAYESFDLGFFTYVIEECSQSSEGNKIHGIGIEVLRNVNLTNNSCVENIKFKTI